MSTVFGKGFLRAAWRSAPEKSAQGKFDCAAGARERRDFVRRRFEQPRGVREGTDGYVDDAPVFGFRQNSPRELTGKRLFTFGQYGAAGKRFLAYKDGAAVRVAYLLTPKAVIKPHRDKFLTDREIISGAEETIKIYANNCYGLSIH